MYTEKYGEAGVFCPQTKIRFHVMNLGSRYLASLTGLI